MEVMKMSSEKISRIVDSWIDEEELPVSPTLKVIREMDPNYGLSEDEVADRNEFIRLYLWKDFKSLLLIPVKAPENDFFIEDFEESAFNTVDFYRLHPPRSFDRYAYRIKKLMEKVMDLAIMHSCISSHEGRLNTLRRYESLVESEFRGQLLALTWRYKREMDEGRRLELKRKIGQLNRRILECKMIWERYAPTENWDR
jgi:hypothetical protein